MKTRLTVPLAFFLSMLTAALATGSALLFLIAVLSALTVALCLAAVLWASATMSVSASFGDQSVYRGDETFLVLQIRHSGRIPVAPVLLDIPSVTGESGREIRLRDMPGRTQSLKMPFHARHIGRYSCGVRSCTVEDLLGIFRKTIRPDGTVFELTVLPRTFPTEPLVMAPGDPGSEIMARATEDLNAPSDVRAYQPGDAMKKIHWKLSLRKGELIVRKFDEPVLQDVLILTDCSVPPSRGDEEADADLRDAILETAASLFSDQLKTDHPVRMPLSGKRPMEADRASGTAVAFDDLAHVVFSDSNRFDRELEMESRRLRKVGCVAAVSARLNYALVDIMIRIHRAGPNLRLYFVTHEPDAANVLPLSSRLKQSGVEVSYVTPDTAQA